MEEMGLPFIYANCHISQIREISWTVQLSQSILRLCGVKNNKYMTLIALLFHGSNLAIISGKIAKELSYVN
jgi:hypothetical protein